MVHKQKVYLSVISNPAHLMTSLHTTQNKLPQSLNRNGQMYPPTNSNLECRICPLCKNEIEDEVHSLVICYPYTLPATLIVATDMVITKVNKCIFVVKSEHTQLLFAAT